MLSYTLEKIPIAMSMAVSLIAAMERNAKKVALFNLQATLPRSTGKEKLVYWYLVLNGQDA